MDSLITFLKLIILFYSIPENVGIKEVIVPLSYEEMLQSVHYDFATQQNREVLTIQDVSQLGPAFDRNKPIFFVCHGWFGSYYKKYFAPILNSYDVNLFVVSWKKGAFATYRTAAANVETAAEVLANFIRDIQAKFGLNGSNFCLIGHSLGAHVVGRAGTQLNGEIGKIIATDPAGPLFHEEDIYKRITNTSAQYVVTIRTNGGFFGVNYPVGHANYIANDGMVQNNYCLLLSKWCSHQSAKKIFLQIAASPYVFCARQCDSFENWISGACDQNPTVNVIGKLTDISFRPYGTFFFKTNEKTPCSRFTDWERIIAEIKYNKHIIEKKTLDWLKLEKIII